MIQEVAVAREVIVQTGRTTISWSNFGAALEKCINNDEMKSIIEAMGMINAIRTARSQKPYHMDLIALLEQFRHRLATEREGQGLCTPRPHFKFFVAGRSDTGRSRLFKTSS